MFAVEKLHHLKRLHIYVSNSLPLKQTTFRTRDEWLQLSLPDAGACQLRLDVDIVADQCQALPDGTRHTLLRLPYSQETIDATIDLDEEPRSAELSMSFMFDDLMDFELAC